MAAIDSECIDMLYPSFYTFTMQRLRWFAVLLLTQREDTSMPELRRFAPSVRCVYAYLPTPRCLVRLRLPMCLWTAREGATRRLYVGPML